MEMIDFKLPFISKWKQDIIHLIYPSICLICEKELPNQNKHICTFCSIDFNYTFFERYNEPTSLDQLFWGRVPVYSTYAYLFFEKGKSTQPILHALKYKNKPEIGLEMGELIGENLKRMSSFSKVQALIPVPIHSKKEFIRGYNQSEKIATGIGNVLNIPVVLDFMDQTKGTDSQTKKGRFLRWDNVENKFKASAKASAHYSHIAIVDDVITTGATLEAIIRKILEKNPEIQISIISLAITK
jgi:ComF family protein